MTAPPPSFSLSKPHTSLGHIHQHLLALIQCIDTAILSKTAAAVLKSVGRTEATRWLQRVHRATRSGGGGGGGSVNIHGHGLEILFRQDHKEKDGLQRAKSAVINTLAHLQGLSVSSGEGSTENRVERLSKNRHGLQVHACPESAKAVCSKEREGGSEIEMKKIYIIFFSTVETRFPTCLNEGHLFSSIPFALCQSADQCAAVRIRLLEVTFLTSVRYTWLVNESPHPPKEKQTLETPGGIIINYVSKCATIFLAKTIRVFSVWYSLPGQILGTP